MSTSDPQAVPGAGWNEEQCTAALARLEQLQEQVDDLRMAIPRIINPFQRPPAPSVFKLYAEGVVSSQNGIKNLQESWKDPEMTEALEHVRKSLGANSDLSASASVPVYGWVNRDRRMREAKNGSPKDKAEDTGHSLSDDEIAQILVEFEKEHPNIKLERQDENRLIKTQFVAFSTMLHFEITIERDANGRPTLKAECSGTTEPFLSITRCIASRPKAKDLRYLLNMIAAYKTVKEYSCAKCGSLIDKRMMAPTARRSKPVGGSEDSTTTDWQALHESCLE